VFFAAGKTGGRVMRWPWILFLSLATLSSAQVLTPKAEPPMRPSSNKTEPTTALDWFRGADNLTNIRMPGSMPFHMKVAFHGYPGIDFAPKGKSTIITGDGVYEETRVSPETWRREVTFGAYHAVEVRAGAVRKFQASFDYEPSRVLMMLRGLLIPVPRIFLEPELEDPPLHWKVERLTAGAMAYVRVSLHQQLWGDHHFISPTYELLPSGVMVRFTDMNGVVTSWQDDKVFASRLVPRQFTVQAMGNNLVTATVEVAALPADMAAVAQLDGPAADPGQTLRPLDCFLDRYQVKSFPFQPIDHVDVAAVFRKADPNFPPGAFIAAIAVIDRNGVPHEAEWVQIEKVEQFIGTHGAADIDSYINNARQLVQQGWGNARFHPPTIDGQPCEVVSRIGFFHPPVVDGSGIGIR
jgi:hypothetical protein